MCKFILWTTGKQICELLPVRWHLHSENWLTVSNLYRSVIFCIYIFESGTGVEEHSCFESWWRIRILDIEGINKVINVDCVASSFVVKEFLLQLQVPKNKL
jgi:hypothetical protein